MVACLLNGEEVAKVEFETGTCDFELPTGLETFFSFVASNDYNVQYYYVTAADERYTNDIRNAGRTISIPARYLVDETTPLFQVHLQRHQQERETKLMISSILLVMKKVLKLTL